MTANKTPRNKAGQKAENASPDDAAALAGEPPEREAEKEKEIGGPKGPEPTRYGDWEQKGRCTDF